ncbi:hypothetical protein [Ottowia oryzae]|uniref:Uncharacterized protein n=1 Tax=Ottowia oryzae TaxID=2109914 RepID=A0A2S0MH88_9BURK|nr:hypothetical protein [Ottowia oryzae]AVO35196.1 hypothetical protein C6570_13850 [Ottowia oryzae]
MNARDDLFCKLYVADAVDEHAYQAAVHEIARGGVSASGAALSALDITARAQTRHLPLDDTQDDCTLWRHYADIEAANAGVTFETFFSECVQLVVGLRERGMRVAPSCDFEGEIEAAARALQPSGRA